jgi:hypothetical protein
LSSIVILQYPGCPAPKMNTFSNTFSSLCFLHPSPTSPKGSWAPNDASDWNYTGCICIHVLSRRIHSRKDVFLQVMCWCWCGWWC